MSISIGKYTIVKDDEFNLKLTVNKPKGSFRGKQSEGTTDKLIGYFGYLDQALSKIVNLELIEAVGDSEEAITARELHQAISEAYDKVKDVYHTRNI